MHARVADLMVEHVITAQRHHTVDHVRGMMERNKIQAVPVVDSDGLPIGILTANDLTGAPKGQSPVSRVMTDHLYTVPAYSDVHVAARVMRNHHIHHVLVTHEQKLVGILSTFDLLRVVEEHRWVPKNPPTKKSRQRQRE